jgi:DeoR family transcriptional regulator of aga operon
VDGIDMGYGCTTTSLSEAMLNKKMIESAQKIIILADSSKFNRKGFGKICDISEIHHIITDSGISSTLAQEIRDHGIQLTLV